MSYKLGKKKYNKEGYEMKIIGVNRNKVKVQFTVDQSIVLDTYSNFMSGNIKRKPKLPRINKEIKNNIKYYGERIIDEYLTCNRIPFKHDVGYFKDLKSNKNGTLRVDFILNDNICIEFDGEGHFLPINFKGYCLGTCEKEFKIRKENDKLKNEYFKNNNIKIIRIPYTHKKFITQILDDVLNNIEYINYKDIPKITLKILSKYKPIDELVLKTWKETNYIEQINN